jgi:hypothetical protein
MIVRRWFSDAIPNPYTARCTKQALPSVALSSLAVPLIHRVRKLFQEFPETVRNWLW